MTDESDISWIICPFADNCPVYKAYYASVNLSSRALDIILKEKIVSGESDEVLKFDYKCKVLTEIAKIGSGCKEYKEIAGRSIGDSDCAFVELLNKK